MRESKIIIKHGYHHWNGQLVSHTDVLDPNCGYTRLDGHLVEYYALMQVYTYRKKRKQNGPPSKRV